MLAHNGEINTSGQRQLDEEPRDPMASLAFGAAAVEDIKPIIPGGRVGLWRAGCVFEVLVRRAAIARR
jgi:glutamate synthase domain-containing protein 1